MAGGRALRWYTASVRSSPALLLTALLALPTVGCAHRKAPSVEAPLAPPVVTDLDAFEDALNHYALLPLDHPSRAAYRSVLTDFLLTHLDGALARDDEDEAEASLRFALSLYAASELRSAPAAPALAEAAHRLYVRTARHGAEMPSLLALAAEQRFGDAATRTRAVSDWETLERWLIDNGPFATEPLLAHEELERALETVAAAVPTPSWCSASPISTWLATTPRSGPTAAGAAWATPRCGGWRSPATC